jgi:hypothetical protein
MASKTPPSPPEKAPSKLPDASVLATLSSFGGSLADMAINESAASATKKKAQNVFDDYLAKAMAEYETKAREVIADTAGMDHHEVMAKLEQMGKAIEEEFTGGLDAMDKDIATHYLDKMKYGVAGSDGTWSSNYWRYMCNTHPILSIFLADKRNLARSKMNNFLVFFNKTALSFLLSVVLALTTSSSYQQIGITVIITVPFGLLVDGLATCEPCHRRNRCVKWSHILGSCMLWFLFPFAVGMFLAGSLVLDAVNAPNIAGNFVLSVALDQLMPFYLGIFNWLVVDWEGFLVFPTINVCGHLFPPKKIFPILGLFPVRMALGTYCLCEKTYEQYRVEFMTKFPYRIAVDKPVFVKQKGNNLLASLMSRSFSTLPRDLSQTLPKDPSQNISAAAMMGSSGYQSVAADAEGTNIDSVALAELKESEGESESYKEVPSKDVDIERGDVEMIAKGAERVETDTTDSPAEKEVIAVGDDNKV